jgi:multicomponent K+:H+ antiporter subunit E
MKRWLPHPLAAAVVFVMWLLLSQSVSPGQIFLGLSVALLSSQALAMLRPEPVRFASLRPVLGLAAMVAVDVVRSNLAVAKLVIFPRERVAGFVHLPLELTNLNGLAVLACIITATPGTIWVRLDRASGTLLVHVLDLIDEDEWIRLIKGRYEAPLLEIFGK